MSDSEQTKQKLTEKLLDKTSLVVHPFLFAVFPLLFLYGHNIEEASVNQILMPIAFSVTGAFLLWLILSLLLKNVHKAGLATTIFVFLFFMYGHFYTLLQERNVIIRHAYLLPAILLAWGYGVYFIRLARCNFKNVTKILNVVAIVLVFINLLPIISHQLDNGPALVSTSTAQDNSVNERAIIDLGYMPDIYYIILDEYAHPSTMLQHYGYDNSQFINKLSSKGFFVASNSRTMYPLTNWSIAAGLNMEYLPAGASNEYAFRKMANNTVANYLKTKGYSYIYSGVWFEKDELGADQYYNPYRSSGGDTVVSHFSRTLWNTTMALPFYDYLTKSVYAGHFRASIINHIEYLKSMPSVPGPKFVFAHIICPHAPFVFGPNGEYINPADFWNFKDRQFYAGQYRFISSQIEDIVTTLLERSRTPPIIIIQSDHGLRPVHKGIKEGVGLGDTEWQKIFNAYYLPAGGNEALYDSISPVNTFRVIFNLYFGTNYELLPDPEPVQLERSG